MLFVEPIGISLIAVVGYFQLQLVGIDKGFPILGALVLGSARLITVAQRIYEGYSSPLVSKARLENIINLIDMPSIKLKPNESFDVGLRKFKRACEKAGIIPEVRKREFYEKPTSVLKRKKAAAVKREQKNQKKNRLGRPPRF